MQFEEVFCWDSTLLLYYPGTRRVSSLARSRVRRALWGRPCPALQNCVPQHACKGSRVGPSTVTRVTKNPGAQQVHHDKAELRPASKPSLQIQVSKRPTQAVAWLKQKPRLSARVEKQLPVDERGWRRLLTQLIPQGWSHVRAAPHQNCSWARATNPICGRSGEWC